MYKPKIECLPFHPNLVMVPIIVGITKIDILIPGFGLYAILYININSYEIELTLDYVEIWPTIFFLTKKSK